MTLPRRPILLVGFMGAGKTTVGRELSRSLGWPFVDLDQRVEEMEGRSIAKIWADEGEEGFRRRESAALEEALAGGQRAVIASGGGLWVRSENRRPGAVVSVWLDCAFAVCRARMGNTDRPLLRIRPQRLREYYRHRYGLYAAADLRVRSDRGAPGDVARRIVRRLPEDP